MTDWVRRAVLAEAKLHEVALERILGDLTLELQAALAKNAELERAIIALNQKLSELEAQKGS